MKKPQWRSRREARKYGGWRNNWTRLVDFGMVKYCQLVKRILLTEGQEDEKDVVNFELLEEILNMKKILYVSDLDGTLLRSNQMSDGTLWEVHTAL